MNAQYEAHLNGVRALIQFCNENFQRKIDIGDDLKIADEMSARLEADDEHTEWSDEQDVATFFTYVVEADYLGYIAADVADKFAIVYQAGVDNAPATDTDRDGNAYDPVPDFTIEWERCGHTGLYADDEDREFAKHWIANCNAPGGWNSSLDRLRGTPGSGTLALCIVAKSVDGWRVYEKLPKTRSDGSEYGIKGANVTIAFLKAWTG